MTSTITFSGAGSGLPVSDWIDALVASESTTVNKLYTKQSELQTSKTKLSTVSSKASSLRTSIEKTH